MILDVAISILLSLPLVGAFGIFAIGIVLIYRASRMLNLAHGAMAMVPAYVLYSLSEAGVPVLVAFPLAVASGGFLGYVVEKLFVSRLRDQGPTAQTVGTVAALGLLIAITAQIYGTASLTAVDVFPRGRIAVGVSSLRYGEIGLFCVFVVVSAALFLLLQRTDLGLMMRGTAESRLAASLHGVNPSLITSFTWVLGGALAGLAGILLAAVTSLNPFTLSLQVLPAFIAALIGGLGSLLGALAGSAVVGGTLGLVPVLGVVGDWQGGPQLFLALVAVVAMALRGRKLVAGADADSVGAALGTAGGSSAPRTTRRKILIGIGVVAAVAFPFVQQVPSSVIAAVNLGASYAIIAVSLVLLTGWVGQISLGHAALVGIGAYTTGHVIAGLGIPFPFSLIGGAAAAGLAAAALGIVAFRVRGLYLAVATLVFSWMASEFLFRQSWFTANSQIPPQQIGSQGGFPFFDLLDRRTFYIVAWAVTALILFAAVNLRDSKTGRAFFAVRGSETAAASLGINVTRYKLLAFATSGAMAGLAGSLMMTDFRVVTADSFTFNTSLFFLAIAVVGGLVSVPGAVASGLLFAGLNEVFFRFPGLGAFLEIISSALLALVLLAYPGGLAAVPKLFRRLFDPLGRAWAPLHRRGRALVRRLAAFEREAVGEARARQERRKAARRRAWERRVPAKLSRRSRSGEGQGPRPARAAPPLDFGAALRELEEASADGAAAAPEGNGRRAFQEDATEEFEAEPASEESSPNGAATDRRALWAEIGERRPETPRADRKPLIEADRITMRFGGLTAVDNASLDVREGEIVGLIGPNGAGKTTLFNSIAGYLRPTEGRVRLYGREVTKLGVHERAQLGVARTFQVLQLFPQLTVYENLLVATHVHNPTGFVSHLAISGASVAQERAARRRVREVLELLDLADLADQRITDLPFGTLRMVEVARALVTGFRVIMLDEPASGLDNAETDRLMDVLRFVRGLGVTLLLIEHDVRMVTSVSDHMFVLDRGKIIAEGPPEQIQRDPKVISAYLGGPTQEDAKEKEEAR